MSKVVKKARKRAANGYQMPELLPKGEVLTDLSKKQWRIGNSIGKGGFGEIYEAQDASSSSTKFPYAIKVEPHENGPLFVEINFYLRNAKQVDVDAFMKKHKLKTFGMPVYMGSGSHETPNNKYRFLVMEKFGADVEKMRKPGSGALPPSKVFEIASQIVYILEYIHELGYIHGDIKGGNVLMGTGPDSKNQAYLVDFGLATKFSTDKVFKPNPKKAHDGTIEYTSCDAHLGVPTRRGDFEVLGYNIIHWLGGQLPWNSDLTDPKTVQEAKEDAMRNIPKFLKKCFNQAAPLTNVTKYFQAVAKMAFNESPNYKKILELLDSPSKDVIEDVAESPPVKKPLRHRKKEQEIEEEPVQSDEIMNDAMKEVAAKKLTNAKKKKIANKVKEDKPEEENFNGFTAAMIEIKKKKLNSGKVGSSEKKTENRDIQEKAESSRPKRNRPVVDYRETEPKLSRKK